MKVLLLMLFVVFVTKAEPVPDPIDEDFIRDGIGEAARDSADLADELAAILAELEEDDDEDDDSFDTVASELEKTLEITEELSQASRRRTNKKSRKPKQFDLGSITDDDLLKALNDFEEEVGKSVKSKQKSREGKQFEEFDLGSVTDDDLLSALDDFEEEVSKSAKLETKTGNKQKGGKPYGGNTKNDNTKKNTDKETCQTEEQTNNVQVCTPDFQSKPQRLQFYGQETYEQEYCYQKTKTECEVSDETTEKEVCTFSYTQANHNVPATNVQITHETHSEKMIVTNCKHVKKDYGKVEEVCEIQYTSQHYDLPVVQEELLELIPLSYPEPEEDCSTFRPGVPSVSCSESSEQFCVACNHIRDIRVNVEAQQVVPSYRGNCENINLTLPQEMCTVERKVPVAAPRQPAYQGGQYNAYQG